MSKIVCVTGASGFLGSHVVRILLEKGYTVHGTVRNVSDPKKTRHLTSLPGASERLHLFSAELLIADSFMEAFANCTGVFHTASPFFLSKTTMEEMVDPALKGTLNVLNTVSKNPSIKRVVITSSTAAVYGDFGTRGVSHVYTEEDWSDVERLKQHEIWYPLGKTMAEKAAFEYMEKLNAGNEKASFDMITMCPTWILGPMLQPTLNESSSKILNYITGKMSTIPNACKCYVDVRDVALAHVLGYEDKNATGRYLLIAESSSESETCAAIQKVYPAAKIPTEVSSELPKFSPFGPPPPNRLLFSVEKAKQLGIHFIGTEEMIAATIDSLKTHAFIE